MTSLQRKSGYIGTLGSGIDDIDYESGLTTPSCIRLHETLADFRGQGATHAVMEVSSHGLDQNRVDGVRFESALFTNLSRDHIDYHGDMQSYFEAKASLFDRYQPSHRIINIDDEYGQELSRRCGNDAITVAIKAERTSGKQRFLAARYLKLRNTGVDVAFDGSWGKGEMHLPLVGEFNVSNALMVLAELLRQGISVDNACEALASVGAPPGRLQRVAIPGSEALPATYVDFAHTPAALQVALATLAGHTSGRIWCIFGCGGDRDRGKRPEMGGIASELADVAIVTNDNPRTEEPSEIVRDIVAGMQDEPQVIEDRGAAIAYAIREASDEDTILIAGKGHEDKQIIGNQALPFSDYQSALFNLKVRAKHAGGVQ